MIIRSTILLMVSPPLTLAQVAAQETVGPTVYGRININAEIEDQATGDSSSDIISNASRLGIRGSTEISDTLDVIYQIEYEVFLANGDPAGRTSRREIPFWVCVAFMVRYWQASTTHRPRWLKIASICSMTWPAI